MDNFLKKKYIIPIIIIVIMIGAFVARFYNHEEWLYFKMDQARDAFLLSDSVENGIGNLPLLGARAGAIDLDSFLRLGPASYYFQYLSGIIFNSIEPQTFAYPDLFFSITVLPLLYLFCRIYFKRNISIFIVLMYAFSFLIIQYSRFAWNPNSLPFFSILSFLGLLKFLNSENYKKKIFWISCWSFGLAIGSQLHFVGFFTLVGISGLLIFYHYNLWKLDEIKKIIQKKYFNKILLYTGVALSVFLFIYIPVIISDFIREGENTKNFFAALSAKPTEQTLSQKFFENFNQQIEHYTLITTSYIYPKKISFKDSLPIIFSVLIIIIGIYLAIKKIFKNKNPLEKDFLMLVLLWFGVFFVLCIPLAYQIRPRFFIVTFAVPFIFLGIIFKFLEEKKVKYYKGITLLVVGIVLISNAIGTASWFEEQKDSQKDDVKVTRTLILKTKDGVTLGQLQSAADYIYSHRNKNSNIYFYVKPEHIRSVEYLFKLKRDPDFIYERMKINADPNAQFFAIVPTGSGESKIENKFEEEFEVKSQEKFGQVTVLEIDFKNREISDKFKIKDDKDENDSDRVFWRDIF